MHTAMNISSITKAVQQKPTSVLLRDVSHAFLSFDGYTIHRKAEHLARFRTDCSESSNSMRIRRRIQEQTSIRGQEGKE